MSGKGFGNIGIGRAGESIAARYMEGLGFSVVARNVYCSHEEIDVICEDESYLVFVEVKTRTDTPGGSRYGRPGAAVNRAKQRHIAAAAEAYIRQNGTKKQPRFDVVEVLLQSLEGGFVGARINHIKGAFNAR